MKFGFRSRNKYSPKIHPKKSQNFKHLLIGLLFASIFLVQVKDYVYLDNGPGGYDWKIGKSQLGLFDAYQSRTLMQTRDLALQLVNRDRQLNGLPPLVEDALLSQAAQIHAQDMFVRNYFSHYSPEGKTPTHRLTEVGGKGGAGENIMKQSSSGDIILSYRLIEEFHKGWMYSPGHRANLLKPEYTHFGYGIMTEPFSRRVFAVQTFSVSKP
ncbi:CAP domain-containing protein [Laspinema sp. D1]|uniref:CAP domain-containing protein n=1 Tax=Laspinema palackyanum D2a TaxID=2953684 RepID=A0ABT2MXX2_9CYAN|nr:CAP domain-containing protein [Laspinema sp. D2b]MCT7969611.1 CAP domain-containing protein [Laspinema sp. D2a]